MTTDTPLPPLPEHYNGMLDKKFYTGSQMIDYARAAQAPLLQEIERLSAPAEPVAWVYPPDVPYAVWRQGWGAVAKWKAENAAQAPLMTERSELRLALMNAEARAERAEAERDADTVKDAQRYRWLRDQSWKHDSWSVKYCVIAKRGDGLDAAIDTAMEPK